MAKAKTNQRPPEAMGGLAKGLAVIRAFSRDRAALSLSEIGEITEMPAATARRCLLTLEDLGYGVIARGYCLRTPAEGAHLAIPYSGAVSPEAATAMGELLHRFPGAYPKIIKQPLAAI